MRAVVAVLVLLLTVGCGDPGRAQDPEEPRHLQALRQLGLQSTQDGFTLAPTSRILRMGAQTLTFVVQDSTGAPVTTFVDTEPSAMQVTVARNDTTAFTHLRPVRAADGTWSVPLTITVPGAYRLFADFEAVDAAGAHHPMVLSVPLTAPGGYKPTPLPPASGRQTVGGLTAELTRQGSEWTFALSAGGRPATGLQRERGAFGHLTALREGDLAYRDAYPIAGRPVPPLVFRMTLPEPGQWRAFLEVRRAGVPHVFAFTVVVPETD